MKDTKFDTRKREMGIMYDCTKKYGGQKHFHLAGEKFRGFSRVYGLKALQY